MNILKLLDAFDIGDKNSEEYANLTDRRDAVRKMSKWGRDLALASLPLSFTNVFANPAISSDDVTDALQFALTLEYLEDEYYQMGLNSGVIDSADRNVFEQISKHETAHVQFLQDTLNSLSVNPVNKPTFDFTANGSFDPFNVYAQFLALSQAFEDTGVRAYKGQAANLISSNAVLTAALQIHSVEARHAAMLRSMRANKGLSSDKPWISQDSRGTLPMATQAVYDGEANVTHLGIDVTSVTSIDMEPITEAWDEPLSQMQVLNIANLFIV